MTIEEIELALAAAGVPDPRTDAELLVAHVLGVPRSALRSNETVDEALVGPLLERRKAREPLQYVLGEWGFRRLTLTVDARALIPRSETETVVERCLVLLQGVEAPRVLDVGTGSGAVALAIVDEHPGAHAVATDVSADALSLARENAGRTGLADRVDFVQGHLLNGVEGPFDLVVSNPPYVLAEELRELEPEVREWEPHLALVGRLAEKIAAGARDVLVPGGWLVLETAEQRAGETAASLAALGYDDVIVTRDLNGAERVVEGRLGARGAS